MAQAIFFSFVLFATWLLFSGIYDNPLLIALGVVSTVLVIVVSRRLSVIDRESQPFHLGPRILFYWPWLLVEILKSNFDVAWRVLSRGPDISPTLVRVPMDLRSDLGRVVYANSITLTPGTVSINVNQESILVHALTREGAASLGSGAMERRVAAFVNEADR